jgi:N-carbamoyl-L-amino-acid hydrolase
MNDSNATLAVNKTRIQDRLEALSLLGRNSNGGIDRNFGSIAELSAREQLMTLLKEEIGAAVRVDAAANIWAEINTRSSLPGIAVGSHHDTVLNGGMYDGALGIILAIEILQVIKENNVPLRHPLTIVSFTAEEPNPFNLSTFGSRIVTEKLSLDKLQEVEDTLNHITLSTALSRAGGSITDLPTAKLSPDSFSAFIECHIEQGKRLENRDISLAVVSHITGIYRENIRICGEANHAGTTMMNDRHDALLAASEFCLVFEKIIKETNRDDVVGTIGHLEISPNAVNIIPGETALTMEIRTPDHSVTTAILDHLAKHIEDIETARGVRIERSILLNQSSVALDETVMAAMVKAIETMSESYLMLTSMAGHDATHLASMTRSGMLFVRSINGRSHCPEENSHMEDIEKAGNALLKTILLLDKELD